MSKFSSEIAQEVIASMKEPELVNRGSETMGRTFWAMETTDPGYVAFVAEHPSYLNNDGVITPAVYTTFALAYAAMTTNRNDTLVIASYGEFSEAMHTVSKSRCHFLGSDAGGRINSQGSKLSTPATSVAASIAVINNTGTRNTYRNIKFIQQGTNAAQTSAFIDAGEGTYMKNCCVHQNNLLTTANTQALLFKGDTCHYEDCEIGNSTVTHNVDNQAPLVIKTPARYSYFINCKFIQYSLKTTASCIDVPDANGIIGWIMFENCKLVSASKGDGTTAAGTMAEAVTSVATSGYLYFDSRCNSFQTTRFGEADASILSAAIEPKANGTGGIAIVSA